MAFTVDSLGLVGHVTTILRELIHDRLGLYYEADSFDQVADRLAPLVVARGLGSFMDYYYVLKYGDDDSEWGRVMDALSVQETYFWREIDQIHAVVSAVVPALVDALHGEPLRIWSVPCASGEEPLTLAMALEEAGWFARAPIGIAASDASAAAIGKAACGCYGPRAFRNLPERLREKYFTPRDGRWQVVPRLQDRVTFDVVNLMRPDQVARHAAVPIVFCRNVFIYFSERSIRRALAAFERSMPDPAYLCVGASESLLRMGTRFELQEIGGAFMYVKSEPLLHAEIAPRAWAAERTS
jgi:chemotaxis protein methyltransferase CheR